MMARAEEFDVLREEGTVSLDEAFVYPPLPMLDLKGLDEHPLVGGMVAVH